MNDPTTEWFIDKLQYDLDSVRRWIKDHELEFNEWMKKRGETNV